MKIYCVIIEDRHFEVEIEAWADKDAAITRARSLAKKYCRFEEDYEERQLANWVFYAAYSCESDFVRVVECEVNNGN